MCVDCETGGSVIGEGLSAGEERPWRKKTLIYVSACTALLFLLFASLLSLSPTLLPSLSSLLLSGAAVLVVYFLV